MDHGFTVFLTVKNLITIMFKINFKYYEGFNMKFIVQKYGGTSIGQADRMKSVAVIVKDSLKNDVFGMSSVLVMPNRSGPWLW
jgi:hypothetical protein